MNTIKLNDAILYRPFPGLDPKSAAIGRVVAINNHSCITKRPWIFSFLFPFSSYYISLEDAQDLKCGTFKRSWFLFWKFVPNQD